MTKQDKPAASSISGLKLLSTALATTLFAVFPASQAWAEGGPGGAGSGGGAVGAPGASNPTTPGGDGGDGSGPDSGGGGGGAGTTGGAGGAGGGAAGGAGGAGGAHGLVGAGFAGTATTGADGSNGVNGDAMFGGGGGGGAGGYGAVITGTGDRGTLAFNVTGGAGGAGGDGGSLGTGGVGGSGGIGILFTDGGAIATINAAVTGGALGVGGANGAIFGGVAPRGEAGAGIVGSGLSLTLLGTVSGAAIAGGATADAIRFLGGVNRLSLGTGWGLNGGIYVDGVLDFVQDGDVTIEAQDTIFGLNNRAIWGGGLLRFAIADGMVTFNGENEYTGGTEIDGGRVAIGHMLALSDGDVTFTGSSGLLRSNITGTLDNNLIIDGANRLTAATGATLTLGGALTQSAGSTTTFGSSTDTGTIVINSAVSGTGDSVVDGGTLNLNGSVGGNLTVNSGATLAGSSTINGNLTLNGGTLDTAGDSIGTTTVNGNFDGGATFKVDVQLNNAGAPVNGTTHDFLNITGDVIGVTTVDWSNFLSFTTPTATTDLGFQLIQVGGMVAPGAFTMTPQVLGAYRYSLAHEANFSGTLDGFFLRSALIPTGCTVTTANDVCGIDVTTDQAILINALAGNDMLQLQGATDFNFDISKFGTTYTNFETLQKAGTSTVTLTSLAANANVGVEVQNGVLVAGTGQLGANGVVKVLSQGSGAGAERGTLRVASNLTVGSIEGGGNIELGAGANLTTGGNSRNLVNTFSGVISGAGGLVKEGTGFLSLTGANTYSGTTTITGGTLDIGGGGTTGSLGTGAVTNNGRLLFLRGDEVTVANAISGTGSVEISSGTVALTGENSYRGGTRIQSRAVLAVGADNNLGATTGGLAFIGGGTLRFNNAFNLNSARAISFTANAGTFDTNGFDTKISQGITGGNGLIKAGLGTLTLGGANTYTGTTTISGGTLKIGDGGTTGSLGTGAVINNGTLAFDRRGVMTVSNTISGTGSVRIISGETILAGANTYSGGTQIDPDGSLTVSADGNLGAQDGEIRIHRGELRFARAFDLNSARGINIQTLGKIDTNGFDATISKGITGQGLLLKFGNGTLTLNGVNTHASGSIVSRGTLQINGSHSGTVRLDGGTLAGTGTITGDVFNFGSTVNPGAVGAVGTLSLGSGYTEAGANGELVIEYNRGGAEIDLLKITGAATLDGTVRFKTLDNTDATGGTFLTATGGVTGKFTTADFGGRSTKATVAYTNNAVSLVTASAAAGNANQQVFQRSAAGFSTMFGVSGSDILEGFGPVGSVDERFGPLSAAGGQAEETTERSIWIRAFGGSGESEGFDGAQGFEHSHAGVAIGGFTTTKVRGVKIGGAIGWSDGEYTLDRQTGRGKNESLMGSLNATWNAGRNILQASLLGGVFNTDTQRAVTFNGVNDTITGESSSSMLGLSLSGSRRIGAFAGWNFAGGYKVQYTRQNLDAATENGTNPLRLTTPERDLYALRNEASLVAGRRFMLPTDQFLDAEVGVGVGNLNQLGSRQFEVTFANSGARLALQGDNRDEAQSNVDANLGWRFTQNMTLSVGATAQFGDNAATQANVGFEMKF
jgi:fibronectin-binding autotransporter adhesin